MRSEVVDEPRDDAAPRREMRADAGHECGVQRNDRRAPFLAASELREKLHSAHDVAHDDVFELGAEEARERLRQFLGGLDAIRNEPANARVLGPDERLDARADPFESLVHLVERMQSGSFPRQFVLRFVEGALALADLATNMREALLEQLLLLGAS